MLPEINGLFSSLTELDGIHSVSVCPNCTDRRNRYDLMIEITMEKDALEVYDSSPQHARWKSEYCPLLEAKAVFDRE